MSKPARLVHVLPGVYAYVGRLPDGCIHCMHGSKIVVFVTGLCGDRCFYCPVSPARLYRDVAYVDEEPLEGLWSVVEEAYRVGADGASITGGDPLARLGRTLRVIKLLKEVFGDGFHIHLYTSGRYATAEALRLLEEAGLDEIRFHPTEDWMIDRIEKALRVLRKARVGVEVPVLPDRVEELKRLIERLDRMGVEFINLNELEASERNMRQLILRGYRVSGSKPVVEGSREAGEAVVRWAAEKGLRISVHFCPAVYKDSVQMRLRLVRKAMRIRKGYEEVTPEGMLQVLVARGREAAELAAEGFGEECGSGVYCLSPRLRGRVAGRLVRRYPALRGGALPVEVEGVAEESDYPS